MSDAAAPRARRSVPLTRARIVEAATAIMDADGDGAALTLRALMTRLDTGSGAIYHHVANMDELRAAAAEAILGPRLAAAEDDADPGGSLRAVSVAIFDAVVAHGWLGAQLARHPLQPAVVLIWTAIGRCLQGLHVPADLLADAGSTLAGFILGSVVGQASGPGRTRTAGERAARLDRFAERLGDLAPDALTGTIAAGLRDHDDRRQFLTGIDFIVRGVLAVSSAPGAEGD